MSRPRFPLGVLLVAFLVALTSACDASEGAGERGPADRTAASGGGEAYRVDLDEIFPEHPGRDLLLANCQSCHSWVPIVILQMNEAEWARSQTEHRPRVEALDEEEFELLYEYVSSTFTPERPVPELPPALLEGWTTY